MSVESSPAPPLPARVTVHPSAPPRAQTRARRVRRAVRLWTLRAAALLLAFALLRADGWSYPALLRLEVRTATAGWGFDLLGWEARALLAKAQAWRAAPAAGLAPHEGAQRVVAYLERASEIRRLEEAAGLPEGEAAALSQLAALRATQAAERPVAEAVIEDQIRQVLEEAGFGWGGRVLPPVLFTFSESPRKLVLSPRARITQAHARMLDDAMPPDAVAALEAALEAGGEYSAYVARTGGLGAFPTMVIDDAPLHWVLSTVAHEWVHTYLAFFPLGFTYGETAENTIINETAADLVGDALGRRALARFYPDQLRPLLREPPPELVGVERARALEEPAFDYARMMAETRVMTDRLLAAGRIADAEQYMELRRLLFVENGYALRRLNQAWFTFHGSYGLSPAADVSTPDAVAPKVRALYAHLEEPRAFLHAIRGVRDAAGLEALLAE